MDFSIFDDSDDDDEECANIRKRSSLSLVPRTSAPKPDDNVRDITKIFEAAVDRLRNSWLSDSVDDVIRGKEPILIHLREYEAYLLPKLDSCDYSPSDWVESQVACMHFTVEDEIHIQNVTYTEDDSKLFLSNGKFLTSCLSQITYPNMAIPGFGDDFYAGPMQRIEARIRDRIRAARSSAPKVDAVECFINNSLMTEEEQSQFRRSPSVDRSILKEIHEFSRSNSITGDSDYDSDDIDIEDLAQTLETMWAPRILDDRPLSDVPPEYSLNNARNDSFTDDDYMDTTEKKAQTISDDDCKMQDLIDDDLEEESDLVDPVVEIPDGTTKRIRCDEDFFTHTEFECLKESSNIRPTESILRTADKQYRPKNVTFVAFKSNQNKLQRLQKVNNPEVAKNKKGFICDPKQQCDTGGSYKQDALFADKSNFSCNFTFQPSSGLSIASKEYKFSKDYGAEYTEIIFSRLHPLKALNEDVRSYVLRGGSDKEGYQLPVNVLLYSDTPTFNARDAKEEESGWKGVVASLEYSLGSSRNYCDDFAGSKFSAMDIVPVSSVMIASDCLLSGMNKNWFKNAGIHVFRLGMSTIDFAEVLRVTPYNRLNVSTIVLGFGHDRLVFDLPKRPRQGAKAAAKTVIRESLTVRRVLENIWSKVLEEKDKKYESESGCMRKVPSIMLLTIPEVGSFKDEIANFNRFIRLLAEPFSFGIFDWAAAVTRSAELDDEMKEILSSRHPKFVEERFKALTTEGQRLLDLRRQQTSEEFAAMYFKVPSRNDYYERKV